MDRGASVEHEDVIGVRPLDRAISCHHTDVVNHFLRKGAKIGNIFCLVGCSTTQVTQCVAEYSRTRM